MLTYLSADTNNAVFQIRPFKDFLPAKGHSRVLSLPLLAVLPTDVTDDDGSSCPGSAPEPRNAYEFMNRRKRNNGDPSLQRWNASIRLANHTSVEHSPLCVRGFKVTIIRNIYVHIDYPQARLSRCLTRSYVESACSGGVR